MQSSNTQASRAGVGLPGLGFLEVPHPIANLGDADLDARADSLIALVVELLTRQAPHR